MTLRDKNLNLLPILLALLEEESVVRAAERVHLSQPATSSSLARLRREFGDPLLVRVGRTMQRTARGQDLLPLVRQHCAELEELYDAAGFDPRVSTARFVIAAPDHLVYSLAREFLERLRAEAPGVRIDFVDVTLDLERHLHEGMVDLAVAGNFGTWPGLLFRPLFRERFVAAMSVDHPLAGRRTVQAADLVDYRGIRRGASRLSPGPPEPFATGLTSLDQDQQVSIGLFTDAVMLTVASMYVTPAPELLVNELSAMLPIVGVPFESDESVEAGVFWAPFQSDSPENLWLRSLVEQTFATLSESIAPSRSATLDSAPSKR